MADQLAYSNDKGKLFVAPSAVLSVPLQLLSVLSTGGRVNGENVGTCAKVGRNTQNRALEFLGRLLKHRARSGE